MRGPIAQTWSTPGRWTSKEILEQLIRGNGILSGREIRQGIARRLRFIRAWHMGSSQKGALGLFMGSYQSEWKSCKLREITV